MVHEQTPDAASGRGRPRGARGLSSGAVAGAVVGQVVLLLVSAGLGVVAFLTLLGNEQDLLVTGGVVVVSAVVAHVVPTVLACVTRRWQWLLLGAVPWGAGAALVALLLGLSAASVVCTEKPDGGQTCESRQSTTSSR